MASDGGVFHTDTERGRSKKLIAGVRFGLRSPAYDCETCKTQEQRNCHNRKGYAQTLLLKHEWKEWPVIKHVEKWDDLKIFECPLTAIKPQTWEILRIVNATVNGDGDILNLPFAGAYMDQPRWYRQAVEIVKRERGEHRRKDMEQRRGNR